MGRCCKLLVAFVTRRKKVVLHYYGLSIASQLGARASVSKAIWESSCFSQRCRRRIVFSFPFSSTYCVPRELQWHCLQQTLVEIFIFPFDFPDAFCWSFQ